MKLLLFANTDWYLFNFRLPLARALRRRGAEVVLVCPPGPFVARLEAAGFRVITIELRRRSIAPWAQVVPILALRRVYWSERPDLVHHFTLKCVILGSLAARLARVPAVVNAVAGLGFVFSSDGFYAWLLRPAVRHALRRSFASPKQRLIVQNEHDRRELVDARLVAPDRIRLIRGSGVDTRQIRPVDRRRSDRPIGVLMATRLLWDKGVGRFAAAAETLADDDTEFLLAGAVDTGNPNAVPEAVIEQWRSGGKLSCLGHVDDIPALLDRVDVVCLPSAYGEGVPRILIEAAAAGLPLVATDAPGCAEIVRHDVNGLVVPVDWQGVDPLIAAIRQLVADPDRRARYGRAGREIAVAEFDEDSVIARTVAVYREVLTTPMPGQTVKRSSSDTPASRGLEAAEGNTASPLPGEAQSQSS